MKFHHIGICTYDINEFINKYSDVLEISGKTDIVFDPLQNANLCMLTLKDGTLFELISGEVVANLLKKRQYLYHTCYVVNNIEEEIEKLKKINCVQITDIKNAILFNNKKVVFLMSDLGLIELLEE